MMNGNMQNLEHKIGRQVNHQVSPKKCQNELVEKNHQNLNGQHVNQNGYADQHANHNHFESKLTKQNQNVQEIERQAPPLQTFENAPFQDLMRQFEGVENKVQPTVDFNQALMLSSNFKEGAGIINGMQIASESTAIQGNSAASSNQVVGDMVGSAGPEGLNTGASYFYKADYIADLSKKCASKDMAQVSKLLTNIGAQDKASNILIEQRNLQRAQTTEGKDIRDLIQNKIVDQNEYIRVKENIAQAKSRSKEILHNDHDLSSSSEQSNEDYKEQKQLLTHHSQKVTENGKMSAGLSSANISSETQEDSGYGKRPLNKKKISDIICHIRSYGQKYLGSKDGRNYERVPLSTICKKLRNDDEFIKRRDSKLLAKEGDNMKEKQGQLKNELLTMSQDDLDKQNKKEIIEKIKSIETVMGLEKRLKTDDFSSLTIAEIDLKPMNACAFDIQNVLFDFCGVNLTNQYGDDNHLSSDSFSNQKRIERLFGKIRKLPKKSCQLTNFDEQKLELYENNREKAQSKSSNNELVKVIGLEPDKLFDQIPKYKVQIGKMPKFSNVFDSIDSIIPGGLVNKSSIPGQSIINPITSQMSFQRIDGRQVISLQFNPHDIGDDPEKKKIYDGYMRDILEQREKMKDAPKDAKAKQETQNIRRAWQNIVKKDIPKAFRMYQKFKADQENNNKKMSQNCLKEVRKRAVKTQRLAKESVMRARKLTKEMCHYWRKRDKEMADGKRKREKQDKELKKRQQEEEEALLQKKRLEYLMQQSEIYAHFMATKLGVSDDHNKGKDAVETEQKCQKIEKVDVDTRAARQQVAGMINENRKRLDDFDDHDRESINEDDLEEQKFNNPLALNTSAQPPDCFLGDLKAYQLKGLQWLDNLYDQGINGILADEMGLGKTIQTIALLAHLAEKKNVWGPFLIIVPVTTLHNWQNELSKFCPTLKVLPYFGSAEERKKLAKFLDPKNLYNPAMRIHVLITSYNLIVGGGKDQLRLQRVKWHYMILDEAQAIKNNASRRWKTLLNFNTRNRLLLSGTPIQNSMAELWALLHFIMPKLFDNHEQFQEWFSKDIEQHSMDQGELNKHQLKRLHLILQPFMLRRLKKDVEQEIAPKIEEIIQCEMTHRQKTLYDRIKRKICTADLFQLASSKAKVENLMNLVMQFRKVCNHPDLFERRLGRIPFVFSKMQHGVLQNMSLAARPEVIISNANPISFEVPQMVYDECFLLNDNHTSLFSQQRKYLDISMSTVSVETHFSLFNIFNELNLHNQIYKQKPNQQGSNWNSIYSILALYASSNNWGLKSISYMAVSDAIVQTVALMHFYSKKHTQQTYMNIHNSDHDVIEQSFGQFGMVYSDKTRLRSKVNPGKVDIIVRNFFQRDESLELYRSRVVKNLDSTLAAEWVVLEPLVPDNISQFAHMSINLRKLTNIYFSKCISEPINISCSSSSFKKYINTVFNNPIGKKLMLGQDFRPARDIHIGRVGRDRSAFLTEDGKLDLAISSQQKFNQGPPSGYQLIDRGLLKADYQIKGSCTFQLPDYSRLVTDCSKMGVLAGLLTRLHKENHRCLIFCQMTKMMDILEDLLIWRKYSYFRMDGSTQLQDRRFMVEEFQTNPNVFVFILSTRAGGLGINLIAADTVIFYDNDWNPTMDSQATDRAHRIGQKKTVHVYRLVTKNTVEERILIRARQKENVQSTVYGANLKADSFSTRDVVDMIIDDIDDPLNNLGGARNQVKGFIKSGAAPKEKTERKKKKKKAPGASDAQGALYESVRRVDAHERYDNEIDQLVNGSSEAQDDNEGKSVKPTDKLNDNQQSSEDEGPDDSEMSDNNSDDDLADSALDKKKLLLKMIDQQTGGAKQIFNFEEDDNDGIGGAKDLDEHALGKAEKTKQAKLEKGQKMQLDDDDEEDIDMDEDPEYWD